MSDDVEDIEGADEPFIEVVSEKDKDELEPKEIAVLRDLLPYIVAQAPNSCVDNRVQFASEQAQIAVCEAIARTCRRIYPEVIDAE